MKKRGSISLIIMLVICSFLSLNSEGVSGGNPDGSSGESFTFAFLADIHLQPELNAAEGFRRAVSVVNGLQPDFVITGGDMIMDALEVPYSRADSLYRLYEDISARFDMPVYNTIGNHDVFGWYEQSGVGPSHPGFGKKLYEERLGRKFYSFDFGGWHFIILDSVDRGGDRGYIGRISSEQLEWIGEDLSGIEMETPIVLSTHIPLVTVLPQLREGPGVAISSSEAVTNSRELLGMFEDHNLKLVLQGHLHLIEEINVRGITFITAGAVSGRWWRGARSGVEEGFALIEVAGESFAWKYVDIGWEAEEY